MKIIEIENSRIAKLLNASITLYPFIEIPFEQEAYARENEE